MNKINTIENREGSPEKLLDPKNWINPKTGERYLFFDKDGNGYADSIDWAKQFEPTTKEKADYKRIDETYLFWGTIWISTVWLGLDHSFTEDEPPLIFETMVFPRFKKGLASSLEMDMERYTTLSQAQKGHRDMVKKWRNPIRVVMYLLKNRDY